MIHKLNTNTIVTAIYYFHKNTLNLGNCEFGFGLKRKPLPIHSLRLTLGIKSCGIILRNVFIGCCGVLTFGGKEKLSISRTWSVWLYHTCIYQAFTKLKLQPSKKWSYSLKWDVYLSTWPHNNMWKWKCKLLLSTLIAKQVRKIDQNTLHLRFNTQNVLHIEAHLEPCQTSKMKRFAKIVNKF